MIRLSGLSLNELEPGAVNLHAPFYFDAIQLQRGFEGEEVELAIAVEPPHITIARADDEAFAIGAVANKVYDESPARSRLAVLAKPISRIVLSQESEEGLWVVEDDENLEVLRVQDFKVFLQLVAGYARYKQLEQQIAPPRKPTTP